MKKALAGLVIIGSLISLSACTPKQYTKVKGEVIGKTIIPSRYGDTYEVSVSYPVGGGNYAIGKIDFEDKSTYDEYNVKDIVTVYKNDKGIGEVTK